MSAIVDTGPLIAFLDQAERHHGWMAGCINELQAPLLVCEPVLTEAMYLLRGYPRAQDALLDLLRNGALNVAFRIEEHVGALGKLLRKYRDTPMSLADACLVRIAELNDGASVLTIDSDFAVYRKHGRRAIALVAPES